MKSEELTPIYTTSEKLRTPKKLKIMNTYNNTPANIESNNAANTGASKNKINDFGAKIGGARKDLYQAANEWAAQLADITAEALTKAGGVSKLVRLPNLEKMTAAGAITADQARAALIIWRGIERKPQGSYRADRWAERTRHRLEAAAAVITATEPQGEDVADIIRAARESAEFAVITAAQWPAVAFSFGKYSVIRCRYRNVPKLQIQDARYYRGTASEDPADIARQLREMVSRDEEQAADRRAAGPALGVYVNRAGVYYIAPADRSEIVLQTYEDRAAALKAYREDRPALVARYTALKNFPACRREWNRPRVGEDWRKGENMTPEKYAAVLPFRGVEFGNWVNQTERAALLNSAFDGFHDLAAVFNIAPAAVTLNGSLAFAFASRGHSGAAAHYEPARRVINLTKKSGAGCMAHEWFHAVDNFAAGGGVHNYATERRDHPAAFAILEAIKRTDYYRRSQNLAKFKGDYWTEGRELTARAFEGVCAVMLNAAGICSDFLVNCKSMDEFTAEDVASRSDYYPYPTADEAAALLPLYIVFLKEVFGDVLTAPAECYEEAKRAAARAEEERKEAERIAAERAEQERKERERKAQERAEQAAREAEEMKQRAARAVELVREVLTARHLDAIATAYDSAAVYAVAHLEGEIYTISADIKTANEQGRAYIESRPAACIQYKRVHNAKRIICRRYQVPEIRANKWNARELCETLSLTDIYDIVRTFATFEKAETWRKAAEVWDETQRAKAEQAARASEKPTNDEKRAESDNTPRADRKANSDRENAAPAPGLHLEDTADGVRVIGDDWKDTYFNKKAIKANGAHWNKEAKQWEATDPADVARLRAWFALRNEEQTNAPAVLFTLDGEDYKQGDRVTIQEVNDGQVTTEYGTLTDYASGQALAEIQTDNGRTVYGFYGYVKHITADTLQQAGEITDTADDAPAVALPDWLTVGAKVRTRGRYMMTTRSRRPEWVEGEVMTVRAISADFVELESRTESGALKSLETISTATAAADLTPVYSPSEKLGEPAESEPAAIAASYDTDEPKTPAEPNRDGLPEWLHIGTRFCLLDFVTGKPTAVRYTCAAIDYEARTVTIPEAADTFRGGSHVYRWDAFHWATFAPVNEDEGNSEGEEVAASYDTDQDTTTLQQAGEITDAADYDPSELQGCRAIAAATSPDRCDLYGFSFGHRAPERVTTFRSPGEAAEWLRRAANGTGALSAEAVDILKVAPDCLIWYSKRDISYNCLYIADQDGKPMHGTAADYRALLLYYRKRHILERTAERIHEATEMGCKFVTSTADRRARVEVEKDEENGVYITSWYVGDERDESRANLHAIEAAEMVYTFREGYAYDLDDITTSNEKNEDTADQDEDPTLTEAEKRDTLYRLWAKAWAEAQDDPEGTRVIVETNEQDPTAGDNEFGRYYMVDGSETESCIEHAGQWVVIRVDTVTSPYEVHRPNFAAAHGYSDNQTQLACRCENPNNVTRWARLMIDAGRVTDIYADCY